ncbi:hypothetical protein EVG20_g4088 [Dentipellis fragilis]|uniref:Uncharacterized protein n=1 Tax=Dentipellis fragilis TaxID=205917 RepID=A0A4Y9YZB5_9AGAM|nr:hypothetical protein EVG20_g4088 [Dentipellis fragilis]
MHAPTGLRLAVRSSTGACLPYVFVSRNSPNVFGKTFQDSLKKRCPDSGPIHHRRLRTHNFISHRLRAVNRIPTLHIGPTKYLVLMSAAYPLPMTSCRTSETLLHDRLELVHGDTSLYRPPERNVNEGDHNFYFQAARRRVAPIDILFIRYTHAHGTPVEIKDAYVKNGVVCTIFQQSSGTIICELSVSPQMRAESVPSLLKLAPHVASPHTAGSKIGCCASSSTFPMIALTWSHNFLYSASEDAMASALVVGGPRRPAGKCEPTQELEELNATRAAVSLPLEILVLIFSNLLSSSPPTRKGAGTELGWIRPPFYGQGSPTSDLSGQESLERAGNAPLCLDRYEANSDTSPPVEDIASRLAQMRVLPIIGLHDILRPLVDRLHGPAPRLESLEVEIRDEEDEAQDHPICEMTKLEDSRLFNTMYASESEEPRHDLEPVSLPHLKDFTIDQNKAVCAAFLRNVVVGPQADVTVYCMESMNPAWETDGDIRTLLKFMANHVRSPGAHECDSDCDSDCDADPDPCPYLSYQFNLAPDGEIEIITRTGDADQRESVQVRLPTDNSDDWLPRLKTMFSMVPPDRLTIIEMRNEVGVSVGAWTEVFVITGLHWPKVHGLLVELDRDFSFLIALLDLNTEAIPALRAVVIDAELGLALNMLDEVASCVMSARERGVPLDRITLRMAPESEGVEQWKDMLAAVVPDFRYSADAGTGQGFYGLPLSFSEAMLLRWNFGEGSDEEEEPEGEEGEEEQDGDGEEAEDEAI